MTQFGVTQENVAGYWRIVWMEMWNQEFIDLTGRGYIKIDRDGSGEFQFGAVTGNFDTDPVSSYFDSTWKGFDEGDEVHGNIYGTLNEEGKERELCGTISFWEGDESEYRAVWQAYIMCYTLSVL